MKLVCLVLPKMALEAVNILIAMYSKDCSYNRKSNTSSTLNSMQKYFSAFNDCKISPVSMKYFFKDQSIVNNKYMDIFDSNSFYIPSFFDHDIPFYEYLMNDVSFAFKYRSFGSTNMGTKHDTLIIHDKRKQQDIISMTYYKIMDVLCKYFNVEVIHGVLNHYSNESEFVPFHKDYYYKGMDMTIGAAFGQQRIFQFLHSSSNNKDDIFSIPQNNGDVFAFTKVINDNFTHGIPQQFELNKCKGKFSVILFAKRISLNERNSSYQERMERNIHSRK